MKYRTFNQIAFFAAFVIGTIAAALFWQLRQPQVESQMPLAVQEVEQPQSAAIEPNYDKARYDEVNSAVESIIENKMQENFSLVPFDEVSQMLSLESVSWDNGYNTYPVFGEERIYHFCGFYLVLELTKRVPGDPPLVSFKELSEKGILYIYHFHPAVHIDGLNNSKERMRIYWAENKEALRKYKQEIEREKKNNNSRK